MMVTVLCWPGAACLGAAPVSSLDEAVVVALSSPANLDSGIMLVTGSLPRKCLLKPATPTKATRDRPSRRAKDQIEFSDERTLHDAEVERERHLQAAEKVTAVTVSASPVGLSLIEMSGRGYLGTLQRGGEGLASIQFRIPL
jgi:hypothetical protein